MPPSGILGLLRCQSAAFSRSERQMILLQWGVMFSVALILWYTLHSPRPLLAAELAAMLLGTVLLQPLSYELTLYLGRGPLGRHLPLRHALLTALDVTIGTILYFQALTHPEFAQVILFSVVALAATRYQLGRALGITSLISLLLVFSYVIARGRLNPQLAEETVVGSVLSLYVVTYLVALVSMSERRENAIARDNERLYRTVLAHNRELHAINRLSHVLALQEDVPTMLAEALTAICTTLNAPLGWMATVERAARNEGDIADASTMGASGRERLERAAYFGPSTGEGEVEWALAPLRQAVREREVVVAHDLPVAGGSIPKGAAYVAVPLLVEDAVFAVLQVVLPPRPDTLRGGTGDLDLQTLQILCNELTVGLDNTMLRLEVQQAVILQEKNRIAQELHDTVAQILFSIGLGLEWCLRQVAPGTQLDAKLRDLRRLSAQGTSEVRSAIFTLSSNIGQVELVPAIRKMVEDLGDKYSWQTNYVVTGVPEEPPLLVQNAIHRIVREGMINIYKHAQATEVLVSLRFVQGKITVVVQDNGSGEAARVRGAMNGAQHHFGLRTVQAQVAELGGTFDVYNADERGIVVRAIIPAHGIDGAPRGRRAAASAASRAPAASTTERRVPDDGAHPLAGRR